MQQTAYNVDDVKRSSSVPSSPTVECLTRTQGSNYERTLKDGNLLLIRLHITISYASVNTKEQRSGSSKAASLRDGRQPVLCCGSTGNVRPSHP